MKQADTADPRVKRNYFFFPAYLAFVLLLAVLIVLPTVLFGGLHLVFESSGSYVKWYFLYCMVLAALVSGIAISYKYRNFEQPVRTLSAAVKKVAEEDFSVYLPIRHASNDMDYIDVLFLDFNKMVEELGSIQTLKNDFATNVSHELKTPLASIQNYAQLLETTDLTARQQEYTAGILESTNRLSSLIFHILRLNKLENQKIAPRLEAYNLCRQLEECALGFETIWEQKQIEFEADLEEVADTGCGMSEEIMKYMFDKFYQGDHSHSTEGNGLGLALVRRVLKLSDGLITVESAEGKGTTFSVSLPQYKEKEGATP